MVRFCCGFVLRLWNATALATLVVQSGIEIVTDLGFCHGKVLIIQRSGERASLAVTIRDRNHVNATLTALAICARMRRFYMEDSQWQKASTLAR